MVGVLFKSYDIEIETLAPVHISSGETLIPNLDYFIDKNELYYLDKEKYLSSLSEDDLKSIFNSILCSSEAIGDQKDNMINAKKFSVKFNANINFGSSKYIYETVKIDGTPYIPGSSLKGAFINGFYYSDNNNSYKPSSNSADHIDFNHNFGFSDAYILHTNDNPLAVYDLYYFSLWSKKGQPLATEFIDKGIKFKTFFLLNKDFSLLSLKQRFKNLNDYSLSIIEREKKWWLKFSEIVTNQGNNYQNNKIHFENLHATVMSQYGELENKIKELQKYKINELDQIIMPIGKFLGQSVAPKFSIDKKYVDKVILTYKNKLKSSLKSKIKEIGYNHKLNDKVDKSQLRSSRPPTQPDINKLKSLNDKVDIGVQKFKEFIYHNLEILPVTRHFIYPYITASDSYLGIVGWIKIDFSLEE